MTSDDGILIYAHLDDLHLTTEDKDNYRDLRAIIGEISSDLADTIDFVYVPGDNADNGLPEQYALAARELARLPMPVHVVTGDHEGAWPPWYAARPQSQRAQMVTFRPWRRTRTHP